MLSTGEGGRGTLIAVSFEMFHFLSEECFIFECVMYIIPLHLCVWDYIYNQLFLLGGTDECM